MEPPAVGQRLQFFDLPLDIRRIVYEEYLDDQCHPPANIIHEEPLSAVQLHWQPAILTVNKQMSAEVLDLFRTRTTFTSRITWQEFEYDMFTKCCIRARGVRPHYDDMQHLRIEIYPPHRDRPIDMAHILRHVEHLCGSLGHYEQLQDLSIVLLENEIASWSRNGKAKESMSLDPYADDEAGFSDIRYMFDYFNALTNVTKATIHLLDSLKCDQAIQDDRKITEKRMMAPYDDSLFLTIETTNELRCSIDEAEQRLKETTGKISRAIIEATWEYGLRKISPEDLHRLKTIWPYTDALPDRDYFPDHKYTGVAPIPSPVNSSVSRCTCLRKGPRNERDRKVALLRVINNPDWYMSPRLRHEVSDILMVMNNCEV